MFWTWEWFIHVGQRLSSAWNGMLDGLRKIPHDNGELPSFYIRGLRDRGQETVDRIVEAFYRRDKGLYARWLGSEGRLVTARENLQLAQQRAGQLIARFEGLKAEARTLSAEVNPPGVWYCPAWAYRVAIVLLALADLPLTYWAFQVFTINTIYLILIAGLVVMALAILGHFAGEYLRRLKHPPGRQLWFIAALAGFLIISLTFLRESSVDGTPQRVGPVATLLVFMGVTGVGFVLPTLLSLHVKHEPMAGELTWSRFNAWIARLGVWLARRRVTRAQRRRERAIANRRSAFQVSRGRCTVVRSRTSRLMDIYMTANVRWREGHVIPPGFHHDLPTVSMPADLDHLTWDPLPVSPASLDEEWALQGTD